MARTHYLRNTKTGAFAGSIGDGKTNIPAGASTLPNLAELEEQKDIDAQLSEAMTYGDYEQFKQARKTLLDAKVRRGSVFEAKLTPKQVKVVSELVGKVNKIAEHALNNAPLKVLGATLQAGRALKKAREALKDNKRYFDSTTDILFHSGSIMTLATKNVENRKQAPEVQGLQNVLGSAQKIGNENRQGTLENRIKYHQGELASAINHLKELSS